MPTRREKIEAMLADETGDSFLRYGLALEWEEGGDHRACQALLGLLPDEMPCDIVRGGGSTRRPVD